MTGTMTVMRRRIKTVMEPKQGEYRFIQYSRDEPIAPFNAPIGFLSLSSVECACVCKRRDENRVYTLHIPRICHPKGRPAVASSSLSFARRPAATVIALFRVPARHSTVAFTTADMTGFTIFRSYCRPPRG